MKHAKLLSKQNFDWEAGKRAMENLSNEDGEINWGAAFAADPGVTSCPNCGTYFWDEAEELQCTECDTKFNSHSKEILD